MICVDASVGVKWIITEQWSDRAEYLAESAGHLNVPLIATPFFTMEVVNVLRQRVRRFGMSQADAEARLDRFLDYPVTLLPVEHVHRAALRLCDQFALPAIYDAYYVLLAEEQRCDFWTDDQRLLNSLNGRLPFVRWIGDFS